MTSVNHFKQKASVRRPLATTPSHAVTDHDRSRQSGDRVASAIPPVSAAMLMTFARRATRTQPDTQHGYRVRMTPASPDPSSHPNAHMSCTAAIR